MPIASPQEPSPARSGSLAEDPSPESLEPMGRAASRSSSYHRDRHLLQLDLLDGDQLIDHVFTRGARKAAPYCSPFCLNAGKIPANA
jgi:hypothetical protein